MTCSLANLLYSWVGAAALGGFLGSNAVAFVSAVTSGAAGAYQLMLFEHQSNTDREDTLTVQFGQLVHITSDVQTVWMPDLNGKPAGFDVSQGSELVGTNLQLGRTVIDGGRVTLDRCLFDQILTRDSSGGAIAISGGIVKLLRCIFNENMAVSPPDHVDLSIHLEYPKGGAIHIDPGEGLSAKLLLDNCEFTNNLADGLGGAIFLSPIAAFNATGCVFSGNRACGPTGCHYEPNIDSGRLLRAELRAQGGDNAIFIGATGQRTNAEAADFAVHRTFFKFDDVCMFTDDGVCDDGCNCLPGTDTDDCSGSPTVCDGVVLGIANSTNQCFEVSGAGTVAVDGKYTSAEPWSQVAGDGSYTYTHVGPRFDQVGGLHSLILFSDSDWYLLTGDVGNASDAEYYFALDTAAVVPAVGWRIGPDMPGVNPPPVVTEIDC